MASVKDSRSNIYILQRQLTDQKDLLQIEKDLRAGQILFVKTNHFFEQYQDEVTKLKNTVDFLKKTCENLGG
ncbi:MAG: hypothetical protein ACTSW5_11060, partial [Promethearchaeota archaeon]